MRIPIARNSLAMPVPPVTSRKQQRRILCSTMHNAWVRYTCSRLESRYRCSAAIVYNNFPWPENPTDAQRAAIEVAAQGFSTPVRRTRTPCSQISTTR